ncbi:hypothetical protein ACF0H5_006665 [Mactra antiquata]
MSYYGGFYKFPESIRMFNLQRRNSQENLSAPLFEEKSTDKSYTKSYGGVDRPANETKSRRSLGKRLEKRHALIVMRKCVIDMICGLALIGVILMMIETELFLFHYVDEMFLFLCKLCISISTFLLLIGICLNYYVNLQINALDAGVKDWQSMISNSIWIRLLAELIVCSIHPFPGDLKVRYTSPTGESKNVSIDAVLSILMMTRLYLIAKFAVVHSRLLTDTSTSSIGALSKIKINTMFVFKATMTNNPSCLLISIMLTTFLVNTWAMRTCENYYLDPSAPPNTYMEVMWLIATTFLTVGYGDKIPQSYCGRYISICTGIMGVGTTALLVAILARKLEQTRSERYVFNMVTRIQIEKRRKIAAANVIKAVIHLWMVKKYSSEDISLERKYRDVLKTSTRQLRLANMDKAHIDEFNVGILEVSEYVNRIGQMVEKMEIRQNERYIESRDQYHSLVNKLDFIKSTVVAKSVK